MHSATDISYIVEMQGPSSCKILMTGPQGNCGCEGGLVDQAFEYIIKNKGIACELFYPYRTRVSH